MEPIDWLEWLREIEPLYGYLILLGGSLIEYLFPPFPGDTITIVGAVMIGVADWSLPLVMGATCVGSAAGALLDFEVGRWLAKTDRETWLHRLLRSKRWGPKVDHLCDRFRRYGAVFILANRFLPAIRSIFFVVAGMSDLRRRWVLLYAVISAVVWNSLLIGVGYAVGFKFEVLIELLRRYTTVVYVLISVSVLVWLAAKLVKARRARVQDE